MTAPDAPTTVRGVLAGLLRGICQDDEEVEHYLAPALRDLARVLSTGPGWTTQPVPADQLAAGDVIAAKDGRLWAVRLTGHATEERIWIRIVRGEEEREPAFDRDHPIPTLLSRTDQRAIRLLSEQLGCTVVGRAVA